MSKRFLPYGTQSIDTADARAVVRVLRSPRLTQGPEVERFEEAFARFVGAPYAVAVSSGTAGLHLACLASGIGAGDEMITTPLTFAATANAVLYAGATPRFADIDDHTLGMDSAHAKSKVTKRTRGFIPVHFAGQPATTSFGGRGRVIEDACHALGAEVKQGKAWKKIGSCHDTDMAVFSFHPVKHIATGEGGMITTRSKGLWAKLRLLRTHGIERQSNRLVHRSEADNPWYYEMQELGFNYRITDFQCALGLSQLKKLPRFVARRREIAVFYDRMFGGADFLRVPQRVEDTRSSFHLYAVRIDFKKIGLSRAQCMERLSAEGIGTQVHYIPVTRQPFYEKKFGFRPGDFPMAEKFYDEALSIPMYPAMSKMDCRRVAAAILKLGKVSR